MDFPQIIAKKIKELCKKNNLSVNKLLTSCDVNTSFLTSLNNGKNPNIENLLKIADYFEIPITYLLDEKLDATMTEEEVKHLEHYRNLDEEGKEKVDAALYLELIRLGKL